MGRPPPEGSRKDPPLPIKRPKKAQKAQKAPLDFWARSRMKPFQFSEQLRQVRLLTNASTVKVYDSCSQTERILDCLHPP